MGKRLLCACIFFITQHYSIAQVSSAEARDAQTSSAHTVTSRPPEFRPMPQAERLRYYFKSTFSVESVLSSAAGAGISQWENSPSEWGQGAEGYARRLGNSYAVHIVRGTLMYGASSAGAPGTSSSRP
jgi:hypothetical protein